MRVVMIQGLIEALDYFIACIAKALEENGVPFYIIDANDIEATAGSELNSFVSESDECIFFTFNNIGALLNEGDDNYWEKNRIPIYSFLVDHPRNFGDLLNQPLRNFYVICQDKNHQEFVNRYYKKVKKTFFVPNGGMQEVSVQPFLNRKIDMVYLGDCQQKVERFPVLNFFQDGGEEFYKRCIQTLLTNSSYTTEETIELVIRDYVPEIKDEELKQLNESIAIFIEFVARRYYKQKMLQELDKAGISVEIYGNNWEEDTYEYGERIHIHSRISSEACNRKIGEAKVTLNFLPWHKNGCSERVYNTMLNGSVCLVDKNEFLQESFQDEKDVLFFELENPKQAVMRIKELLEEPGCKTLERIASRGYSKAIESDTWRKRTEKLLEIFGEYTRCSE